MKQLSTTLLVLLITSTSFASNTETDKKLPEAKRIPKQSQKKPDSFFNIGFGVRLFNKLTYDKLTVRGPADSVTGGLEYSGNNPTLLDFNYAYFNNDKSGHAVGLSYFESEWSKLRYNGENIDQVPKKTKSYVLYYNKIYGASSFGHFYGGPSYSYLKQQDDFILKHIKGAFGFQVGYSKRVIDRLLISAEIKVLGTNTIKFEDKEFNENYSSSSFGRNTGLNLTLHYSIPN